MNAWTLFPAICAAAASAVDTPQSAASDTPPARSVAVPAAPQDVDEAASDEPKAAAPQFDLEDQFGEVHNVSFPADEPAVFVLADREGSRHVEGWVRWLGELYGERVTIYGIARLEGVPRVLRSTVKLLFKREAAHPVLLDWTGEITDRFDFKAGMACVFVADTTGAITCTAYGPWNEARGGLIRRSVETALAPRDTQSTDAAP